MPRKPTLGACRAKSQELDRGAIEIARSTDIFPALTPRLHPRLQAHLRLAPQVGGDVGSVSVKAIDARAADKIYERLKVGPRGPRLRQANVCIIRAARALDVVARLHPKDVPTQNPFRGVELTHANAKRPAATRQEAYSLHEALIAVGEQHLAVVPLVCFEWLQRPENIIAGPLSWPDYRSAARPNSVRVERHKTGAQVWMPLADENKIRPRVAMTAHPRVAMERVRTRNIME